MRTEPPAKRMSQVPHVELSDPTSPTGPLRAQRIPKWAWGVGGGVALAIGAAVLFFARQPSEPDVVELPAVAEVVVEPPPTVSVEQEHAESTDEPAAKDHPRKEAPKKKEVARVGATPKVPAQCEGADPKWTRLNAALERSEQTYLGKSQPIAAADKELSALRAKVKAVKTRADCINVMGGLERWQKKYSN